jgi:RNA polymerase sigma factor (TIGR02999 family)
MSEGKAALDDMAPAMYDELRRLARHYLSGERSGHTLQPTALVHEAYLRLAGQRSVDWSNRAQFLGLAASMMRRILINYARSRAAAKRAQPLQVETGDPAAGLPVVDLLDLHRALEELAKLDARQEKIVELRFFAGLSIEETAEVLGLAPITVNRDWATARLWLMRQVRQPGAEAT